MKAKNTLVKSKIRR